MDVVCAMPRPLDRLREETTSRHAPCRIAWCGNVSEGDWLPVQEDVGGHLRDGAIVEDYYMSERRRRKRVAKLHDMDTSDFWRELDSSAEHSIYDAARRSPVVDVPTVLGRVGGPDEDLYVPAVLGREVVYA